MSWALRPTAEMSTLGRYRRRRRLRVLAIVITLLVLAGLGWAAVAYGPDLYDRLVSASEATESATGDLTATIPPTSTASASATADDESAPRLTDDRTRAMEEELVSLTNAERRKVGCAELVLNQLLVQAARAHSVDMVESGYFEHQSPDGDGPGERLKDAGYDTTGGWAENIARGYETPVAAVQAWMASAGHKANILNCSMKSIGVGVARAGNGRVFWTAVFGGR